MHVAINAYFWNLPNTGSGQYTRQLVYHLNRLVTDLEITLIYPRADGDPVPRHVQPSVHVVTVPARGGHPGKVYFEQVTFPRAARKVGANLAHVPYWGPPIQAPVPVVVTVHDLTTMLVREYRRGVRARLYSALVSTGTRAAAQVITDSRSSQADILKHLSIGAEKVTAIYLAVGKNYSPESDLLLDMATLKKYELPETYILYLGGYELHKNVVTLLKAYHYVKQALGDDYPLVLAGRRPDGPSAHYPDYARYVGALGIRDEIHWTGFIDEADKPAVYRGASCFVFLSRYEGFGLPPLEAMACGVPVVASNGGALPEVLGDAGFAIDPDDERQVAGSIIATIVQEDLAAELRTKGLKQAERFSWENTATETLLVYEKATG